MKFVLQPPFRRFIELKLTWVLDILGQYPPGQYPPGQNLPGQNPHVPISPEKNPTGQYPPRLNYFLYEWFE